MTTKTIEKPNIKAIADEGKIAVVIKTRTLTNGMGNRMAQVLFEMKPAYEGCNFVLASAGITSDHGAEVYLFKAYNSNWDFDSDELPGSVQGTTDIEAVIRSLGYRVVK